VQIFPEKYLDGKMSFVPKSEAFRTFRKDVSMPFTKPEKLLK
jgi:hypothetical protein